MQLGGTAKRVQLNTDLTRYGKELTKGAKGWTMPDVKLSIWGSQDRFCAVKFDSGTSKDILFESLDFI